jgi:hypothetical protein
MFGQFFQAGLASESSMPNLPLLEMRGKKRECSTIFEAKCEKSARNIGIDQQDAGESAPHLVSFIAIL